MNPRHQIFVSSTFRDLIEERQAVLDAILEMNNFPAGMEIFPAANATPWELIESIIAESDYYILIIGGKYGSTDEHGISYTEREFDLAVKLGKPILPFIHKEPETIPVGKSEISETARNKLTKFIDKVQKLHCKRWSTKDELKAQVVIALNSALRTDPMPGWVRADGINNTELVSQVAELHGKLETLREENIQLQNILGSNPTVIDDLVDEKHTIEVSFNWKHFENQTHNANLKWDQIFFGLGETLLTAARESDIVTALNYVIYGNLHGTELWNKLTAREPGSEEWHIESCIRPTEESILTITIQLTALGLIEPVSLTGTHGEKGRTNSYTYRAWKLSDKGLKKFLDRRAIKK